MSLLPPQSIAVIGTGIAGAASARPPTGLLASLAEYLRRPVDWQHCAVHRWRYATPAAQQPAPAESCWWDAAQGLGACGDFLGGGGVEGAWMSAQALSKALLQGLKISAPSRRPR